MNNQVNHCLFPKVFEQVTIIFNDIPSFMDICSKCDGLKIVSMLNNVFGIFDNLSDRNNIYKIETVKDSFVGVSGAPEKVCYIVLSFSTKYIVIYSLA